MKTKTHLLGVVCYYLLLIVVFGIAGFTFTDDIFNPFVPGIAFLLNPIISTVGEIRWGRDNLTIQIWFNVLSGQHSYRDYELKERCSFLFSFFIVILGTITLVFGNLLKTI